MSIALESLVEKHGMIQWIKDTADRFITPFITVSQRMALQRHVNRMEAYEGAYVVDCKVAQDASGQAMTITVTIYPRRTQ